MKLYIVLLVLSEFAIGLVPQESTKSHSLNRNCSAGSTVTSSPACLLNDQVGDDSDDRSLTPTSIQVHEGDAGPKLILGHLLLIFGHHLIYAFSGKVTRVTIKKTVDELLKHKMIGEPNPTTMAKVERVLTEITFIVLALALLPIAAKEDGMQRVTVGADDGNPNKRTEIQTVSWDISDNDKHAVKNQFKKRSIVGDELRSQMIDAGNRNITFMHIPSTSTPILAYLHEDNTLHYHWQNRNHPDDLEPRGDQVFKKHYPFFDARGLGFKISSLNSIGPNTPPVPPKSARKIAAAIVKDLLKSQSEMGSAGYTETFKDSNLVGHRLCYQPMAKRFSLRHDTNKCFQKGK